MNKELLSKEQINIFSINNIIWGAFLYLFNKYGKLKNVFDLRLLEMMRIIMILDSLSHQIFDPKEWNS